MDKSLKFIRHNIRAIVSIIAVLIIGISTIISGYFITMKKSKAANEDTVIYESDKYYGFVRNGRDYGVQLYRTSEDEVVYCTEYEYAGPDNKGSSYIYSDVQPHISNDAQEGINCILSWGYIGNGNEEIFNHFNLSETQAEAATAIAIKSYLCDRKEPNSGYSFGYSESIGMKSGEEETYNAMKWLYDKAISGENNSSKADISISELSGERDGLYYVKKFKVSTKNFNVLGIKGLTEGSYSYSVDGDIITVKALFKPNLGNSMTVEVETSDANTSYSTGYYLSKGNIMQTMVTGRSKKSHPNDLATGYFTGTYDEYGWLEITKKDSSTGELLNGAVFYVYKDASCNGEPICKISTGKSYITLDGNATDTKGIGKEIIDAGTYYVTEYSAPYGYEKTNEVKEVKINYNTVTSVEFYNNKINTPFSIVKRSAEDGDVVVGATYSIYDVTSKYNEDKNNFGNWLLDTTNKIHNGEISITSAEYGYVQSATTDSKGVATFDSSKLSKDHMYSLIETEAPKGYQIDPVMYMVNPDRDDWKVSDYSLNNTVSDYYLPGKISVYKTDTEGNPLAGVVFGVYEDAACTIPAHEVYSYKNGYCAFDENNEIIKKEAPLTLITGADGKATSDYITYGKYYIKEISGINGYEITDEVKSVITGYTYSTPTVHFENKKINGTVEIWKTDALNNQISVSNAVYGLFLNGQLYKQFPATNEFGRTRLTDLPLGNYTIKEIAAPEGYELDESSYTVSLTNSSNIQGVDVKGYYLLCVTDKPVINSDQLTINVNKIDQFGNFVKGANLQLINSNNDVVAEWTSGEETYVYTNKKDGRGNDGYFSQEERTFRLHEVSSPDGYSIAQDITFTIDENTKTTNINMVDATGTGIYVEKVDDNGNNVKNAKLQLIDNDGNVADEWVSDGTVHFFDFERYVKSKYGEKHKFTQADFSYILHEVETPENYLTADDIKFDVDKNTYVSVIRMIDVKKQPTVRAIKVNDDGDALAGAKLQVLDKQGNVVDEWVSDGGKHVINGLSTKQTYILHEAEAPYGYTKADDIEFTVPKDGNKDLKMVDKKIPDTPTCKIYVYKEDDFGSPLEGAVLAIFDLNQNELFRWTTTSEPYVISNLPVGETYILQEISAPSGFDVAENISITTKSDDVTIHMIDNLKDRELIQTGEEDNFIKIVVFTCTLMLGIIGIIISISWRKSVKY